MPAFLLASIYAEQYKNVFKTIMIMIRTNIARAILRSFFFNLYLL